MKTTIVLPDALLDEARDLARRENTTLKALVEEGLRRVVAERSGKQRKTFALRDGSFRGSGLQLDVAGASWDRIRELAHEGRSG